MVVLRALAPFGAPLYGPDNRAAGRIAGRALGAFARETWPDEQVLGVLIGDLAEPSPAISDRVQGITEGIHESLLALKPASLDTGGQSVRADALLTKFLQTQRGQRLLIATLDDLAAVYAKNAIEINRRQSDCIIVSQGLDPNIHGGASEKKEIARPPLPQHDRAAPVDDEIRYQDGRPTRSAGTALGA